MVKNMAKDTQITRNHRAKIRWGSETEGAIKPSVTGEVALPEPALSDGGDKASPVKSAGQFVEAKANPIGGGLNAK